MEQPSGIQQIPDVRYWGSFLWFGQFFVMYGKKYKKNIKTLEKKLAFWKNFHYTNKCCDMIAMKREVAVKDRFSVERMSS